MVRRLLQRAAWVVAAAALAGCATLPPGGGTDEATLFADQAFAPPSRAVEARDVFALSPAMRDYLEREIGPRVDRRGLQRGLVEALFSGGKLALGYDATFTRNAAEAFEARAGNCLSLAIMTGAFAKELGLAVRYRSVQVPDSWGRDGDLALFVGHVNISVGRHPPIVRTVDHSPDWWTIDFIAQADIRRQQAQPIDEARVVAMYMGNKAAEALARGQRDDAYWWIRAAIRSDPRHADAYNTLGLVYLRHGLVQQAEVALRAALALSGSHPQALNNLVLVLRREGREAEAVQVESRLARLRAESPFADFERGRRAYDAGDFRAAKASFERALARSNDFHEFHHWLALACLQLGERESALRHLRQAGENSNTPQQQSAYAMKLERLKAAAH
ncbi:MAG: tetratricopeptide repeat protein [Pseudomonadota bacterium]